MHHHHTLGVAMISMEGELDQQTSLNIWKNRSRPPGHLLPEILCSQLGLVEAATLAWARVVRIVVHPGYRRMGIATALLRWIENHLDDQIELWGSSFGMNHDLIGFWSKLDYFPARVSVAKSHNTGTHSCVFIKANTTSAHSVTSRASSKFKQHFQLQLGRQFKNLDPTTVRSLYLAQNPEGFQSELAQNKLIELVSFAFADATEQSILDALLSATELILQRDSTIFSDAQLDLITQRVLQGLPWRKCQSLGQHEGKKQGVKMCREIIKTWLEHRYKKQLTPILETYQLSS